MLFFLKKKDKIRAYIIINNKNTKIGLFFNTCCCLLAFCSHSAFCLVLVEKILYQNPHPGRSLLFDNYWIKSSMIVRFFFSFFFCCFAHVTCSGAIRLERKFYSFSGCLHHSDRRHPFCSGLQLCSTFANPAHFRLTPLELNQ